MKNLLASNLLLVLLSVPTVSLALQGPEQTVLANDGRVLRILSGSYGELFPAGQQTAAHHAVLAIEDLLPDGTSSRMPVPGTLGPDQDLSPSAAYVGASDSLALVWEKQFFDGATTLNLIGFSAGRWSPMQEITGHTQSRKWSPSVAITQDRDPDNDADRTIFHIIWAEGIFGYETTFYSPVLWIDGSYFGRNPVLRLSDWSPPANPTFRPGHALLRTPSEEVGGDRGTVVLATASATTGRFLPFDLKVHPEVTGRMADRARERILASDEETDLESMVADVRAHIIIAGGGFQPSALIAHLADAAEDSVRALHGEGDLHSLADSVRAHIIIAGDRWLFPQRSHGHLRILDAAGGEGPWTHIVTVTALPGRDLPELDAIAENPRSLLSDDGREALVAWRNGNRWRYVESRADGWSEVLSVHPSIEDPEAIDRLFARRLRSR